MNTEKNKKIKVFVWDTETTGLWNKKNKIEDQPHIVQFSGILVEMDNNGIFNELERVDIKIKPPIPIPYQASQVHHIYDVNVRDSPTFLEVADKIQYYLNTPDVVVGHNVQFDENIIRTEFERLKMKGLPFDYAPQQTICTMKSGTNFCKLPKRNEKSKGYKAPKLQELTKKTLGTYFTGAHDAMTDVIWTLKSLSVLVRKGVIKLQVPTELKLF